MYYMSEVQSVNSYRIAEPLKATNLSAAKREASRKQVFEGTVIYIAEDVFEDNSGDGRIWLRPEYTIACKRGGKWQDLD